MCKKIKINYNLAGYIKGIYLILAIFNLFIIFSFLSPVAAEANTAQPDFQIGFGNNKDVRENLVKYVKEDETIDASIYINNAEEVDSLWVKVYLDIKNLSISKIKSAKEFCTVWDQEPVYNSEGFIEILCAPSGDVTSGKILDLELVKNNSLSESFVTLETSFLNEKTKSIQTKLENSTLSIVDETTNQLADSTENLSVQQTSGDLSSQNSDDSQIVLIINIILIFGIFITLFLGFRSLRLTRQEDKLINKN